MVCPPGRAGPYPVSAATCSPIRPRKLRELGWPSDVRVPTQGDALEVRRPDGSVVFGTVWLRGIYAQGDGKVYVTTSDPADPEVSVMIDGIAEDELWPGSEIWIQAHPSRRAADAEAKP